MIDIHSHILPGIDDGAKSSSETLDLLKKAEKEGISSIIATPHHNPEFKPSIETITSLVNKTNTIAQNNNLDINVLVGQEIRLYENLVSDLENNNLLTLNQSKYILIEFPSNHVPDYAQDVCNQLQMSKYQPIIVHPERNTDIIKNPNILYDLVQHGALAQITAGSIIGKFGTKAKKTAFKLIEHELIHFIASDTHHLKTKDFHMKAATKKLSKIYGQYYTQYLIDNAKKLVNNETIQPGYPQPIRQ